MTVLRESVPWIRSGVDGLSRDVLREPEAPGKWSLVEVAQHLADTELIYRYRMRLIVAQPGSDLPAYDQDRWVENLNYHDVSMSDSLGELSMLRRANLRWLQSLTDEELERTGIHDRRGPESVRGIVQLLAGHDLVHRHQIERIKAAVA